MEHNILQIALEYAFNKYFDHDEKLIFEKAMLYYKFLMGEDPYPKEIIV